MRAIPLPFLIVRHLHERFAAHADRHALEYSLIGWSTAASMLTSAVTFLQCIGIALSVATAAVNLFVAVRKARPTKKANRKR